MERWSVQSGVYYELTDRFVVNASLERTWEFFSAAGNLPIITPPWLRFEIRTAGPIAIEADFMLDYTIRWLGMPIRWRTRIIDWSPPRQFIDLQLRGPYALWHHQHTFTPTSDGVLCRDRVTYRLPGGPAGRLAHAVTVRRQLLGIFAFRRKAIAQHLAPLTPSQSEAQIRAIR